MFGRFSLEIFPGMVFLVNRSNDVFVGASDFLPDPHESQVEQVLNDLITVCWAQNIHTRPPFKDVRSRLGSLGFGQ